MSKETQELTRNPNLVAFQTNLLAEYREKNKTAKKGQTLFIGSSIMELFPIEKWEEAGEVKFACLYPGHYDAGMKGQVTVVKK